MSSSYQSASLINMDLGQNLHKTKNPWPVFPVQTMYLSQFYHLIKMEVQNGPEECSFVCLKILPF